MKDKTVEIYLQTPLLFIPNSEDSPSSKVFQEGIIRLVGKVIVESTAGILIVVKTAASERRFDKNPGIGQLFIPFHKIDHIVVEK